MAKFYIFIAESHRIQDLWRIKRRIGTKIPQEKAVDQRRYRQRWRRFPRAPANSIAFSSAMLQNWISRTAFFARRRTRVCGWRGSTVCFGRSLITDRKLSRNRFVVCRTGRSWSDKLSRLLATPYAWDVVSWKITHGTDDAVNVVPQNFFTMNCG